MEGAAGRLVAVEKNFAHVVTKPQLEDVEGDSELATYVVAEFHEATQSHVVTLSPTALSGTGTVLEWIYCCNTRFRSFRMAPQMQIVGGCRGSAPRPRNWLRR